MICTNNTVFLDACFERFFFGRNAILLRWIMTALIVYDGSVTVMKAGFWYGY